MGETWKGGDVGRSIGGGQKVRLLKEAMDALEVQEDQVVLSVDRYDLQHFSISFSETQEGIMMINNNRFHLYCSLYLNKKSQS